MAFTNATKEAAALAVSARGNSISLHTGDPGVTGANEVTGGTPAYARKSTTWTGASDDGNVVGTPVQFDVPGAGQNYTHMGIWNGSTFIAGYALSSPTGELPGQQTVTVTPTISVA